MTNLIERQILPGVQRALSDSRADAVTRRGEERWRIPWRWPPNGWVSGCQVAISNARWNTAASGRYLPVDDTGASRRSTNRAYHGQCAGEMARGIRGDLGRGKLGV